MITAKRKLWLMIAFTVRFNDQEKKDKYYDNIMNQLDDDEVMFIVNFLEK